VIVSKEAACPPRLQQLFRPPGLVGKSVHIRADDHNVRIILDGVEVAAHTRCWERRRHVQDPAHAEELLARRKAARPQSRRETLAAVCPESRIYFQEIARRRIRLDSEMSRIFRLVDSTGSPRSLAPSPRRSASAPSAPSTSAPCATKPASLAFG